MGKAKAQARALVAPLARKRQRLVQKGKTRPHKAIAPRLPAGAGDLKSVPKGKEYMTGRVKKGGKAEASRRRGLLPGGARLHGDAHRVSQGDVDGD